MRAVVDIGSNSIKLNVFDTQRGAPKTICHKSWITQLGRDIRATSCLHKESLEKTDRALHAIASILDESYPEIPTVAVATAAARVANNSQVLVDMVHKHLKIDLSIISTQKEAHLSALGALSASRHLAPKEDIVFVDVGGASTEVATFHPAFSYYSFQTGALSAHQELNLEDIPNNDQQWSEAKKNISSLLPKEKFPPAHPKIIVAVGGTLHLAARLSGGLIDDKGIFTTGHALEKLADKYRKLDLEQRISELDMPNDRAKILPAGILCLIEILNHYKLDEVFVTNWGLRHGIVLEEREPS